MMKDMILNVIVFGGVVEALSLRVPHNYPRSDISPTPWDTRAWQAPGPNDIRSPCPGFNTLANHGYINRDGRNVTAEDIRHGFLEAFGLAYDVTDAGAINTMTLCTARRPRGSPECTSANIDVLDTPHALEHDGSMRADDKGVNDGRGDNKAFSAAIMSKTEEIWGSNTHITYNLSETVRQRRCQQQKDLDDPGWFRQNNAGSLTEHAFVLATMSDPDFPPEYDPHHKNDKKYKNREKKDKKERKKNAKKFEIDHLQENMPQHGNARIDWVKYWFEQERLPTQLGWVKPATTIHQGQIASITDAVSAATTIPLGATDTATTHSSEPTSTPAPPPGSFPFENHGFNPYRDVQRPDRWNALLSNVENSVVEGAFDLLGFS